MKYKTWQVSDDFIKEEGLDKGKIQKEIEKLKITLSKSFIELPGVVVVAKVDKKWVYQSSAYCGPNKPFIAQKLRLKKPPVDCHVIAILTEIQDEVQHEWYKGFSISNKEQNGTSRTMGDTEGVGGARHETNSRTPSLGSATPKHENNAPGNDRGVCNNQG